MKKTFYGKWSFILTIISLVLGGIFLTYLLTGAENFDVLNRTIGYIAGILLLIALIFSIISKVKSEAEKWKIAPWIGLGIVILAIITMFVIFLMNDFAP
ncbi:hypothetical protein DTX80_17600 [Bacilli bacterium]|uniref:hypothetical protein n=1 Tax=Oceanobacillus TaxID=182709 RepID=UPI000621C90D|nr:hypothetical protein WH51_14275 [Bacilli bacterium VT-13-104]PZD83286.1 hypothetical protein DEJ64_15575 [Bacilli bacterium]PZD84470.1 hypothetical protein DEJ60_14655 [Bacilli bacterium]PZD86662.1 hypothetical protein DEJ66_15075 [Bacilli bacterium]RCO04350.1 hypothetical protein DTX80_17600 [Bacilli bacterium]